MYMFARRWPCNDPYLDTSFLSGVELGDDGNPTGPLGPTILFEAANTEFEQDVEVREPCLREPGTPDRPGTVLVGSILEIVRGGGQPTMSFGTCRTPASCRWEPHPS